MKIQWPESASVERAPPPAAFDVDFAFDSAFVFSCHPERSRAKQSAGPAESKACPELGEGDPNTARSSTEAARHSPRGPYRGVVRMPTSPVLLQAGKGSF